MDFMISNPFYLFDNVGCKSFEASPTHLGFMCCGNGYTNHKACVEGEFYILLPGFLSKMRWLINLVFNLLAGNIESNSRS